MSVVNFLPREQRTPDTQYRDRLKLILERGKRSRSYHVEKSVCILAPPPLNYDLRNGVPLITERSMKGIWKSSFAEIIAFLNGVRTLDELLSFGVNEAFWGPFVTKKKCADFDLETGDLGEGSYGPALKGQIQRVIHLLRNAPHVRTHFLDPWIPHLVVPEPGQKRRVVVAPCHGWMHFRVLEGENGENELHLNMFQRSADMPVGVPSNIFQYAALLVAVAHVVGMPAGTYNHLFSDAHIYEHNEIEEDGRKITQRDAVEEMISREPRVFPTIKVAPDAPKDILDFRPHHLIIEEYDPHPPIKGIEVAI